jgi:hypothetical protein
MKREKNKNKTKSVSALASGYLQCNSVRLQQRESDFPFEQSSLIASIGRIEKTNF